MENNEIVIRIYNLLKNSDLAWHSWCWWAYKDSWFSQFTPEEIDAVAAEMAKAGMIEANENFTGFRRKEKTLKEKIYLKIWG